AAFRAGAARALALGAGAALGPGGAVGTGLAAAQALGRGPVRVALLALAVRIHLADFQLSLLDHARECSSSIAACWPHEPCPRRRASPPSAVACRFPASAAYTPPRSRSAWAEANGFG